MQITCSTQSAYLVQHVVCHVVRRNSSAIKFDRVEIAFISALFYWLKPLTDEGLQLPCMLVLAIQGRTRLGSWIKPVTIPSFNANLNPCVGLSTRRFLDSPPTGVPPPPPPSPTLLDWTDTFSGPDGPFKCFGTL